MNEGTNGRTNRQLARGPSESRAERGRETVGSARPGKGLVSRAITGPRQPRHYPQLSACVLRLGFRVPSGARIRARATARHRDPNVRTGLWGTEQRKKGVEEKMQRETGAPAIHYVASAVRHGSISPFWRGVWSARLFLRPQKPRDRNGRMLCGDHPGECQDGCVISKYLNTHTSFESEKFKFPYKKCFINI